MRLLEGTTGDTAFSKYEATIRPATAPAPKVPVAAKFPNNNLVSTYIPRYKECVGISERDGRWKIQRTLNRKHIHPSPQYTDTKEEAAVQHDIFLLSGAGQDPPITRQEARDMVRWGMRGGWATQIFTKLFSDRSHRIYSRIEFLR